MRENKSKTDTLQKLNTSQKKQTTQNTAKQNYRLVRSPHTTLGQETKWAYSTTLPSPHGDGDRLVGPRSSIYTHTPIRCVRNVAKRGTKIDVFTAGEGGPKTCCYYIAFCVSVSDMTRRIHSFCATANSVVLEKFYDSGRKW